MTWTFTWDGLVLPSAILAEASRPPSYRYEDTSEPDWIDCGSPAVFGGPDFVGALTR